MYKVHKIKYTKQKKTLKGYISSDADEMGGKRSE